MQSSSTKDRTNNRLSKLTPKFVKEVSAHGVYQDGRGLMLRVSAGGKKNWVFRFSLDGRHDLGLGTYPSLSLRDARLAADQFRLDIARGINPVDQRAAARAKSQRAPAHSFKSEAERYVKTHSPAWSEKHAGQWRGSLERYVYPVIGRFKVEEVETEDVLEVLEPIWSTVPVTARRVRNRIELVLDAARARNLRSGENPARWRGHLDKLLPKQGHVVCPYPAMSPRQAASLLYQLDGLAVPAARACELAVLSAARNQEVCRAEWDEINWQDNLWIIPASRMKARREHRIPLTERMRALFEAQQGQHDRWIFPDSRGRGPLPGNAIGRMMVSVNFSGFVPHGLRSTFRTWAAEHTDYPREVCEMALAHSLESRVEAAYNRGDLLEKRRRLMQSWEDFLISELSIVEAVLPSGSEPVIEEPACA